MSANEFHHDLASLVALSRGFSHLDTCAFTRLKNGTYLQGRAPEDVYEFLAGCLAVRAIDLHELGIEMDGTPYQTPLRKANLAFQDLLIKAESIPNLLPAKWDRLVCIEFCTGIGWLDKDWPSSTKSIEEIWDVDDAIVLKLRCLGEVIYGGAVDGKPLLDRMAALEAGVSKSGIPPGPKNQHSQTKQTS